MNATKKRHRKPPRSPRSPVFSPYTKRLKLPTLCLSPNASNKAAATTMRSRSSDAKLQLLESVSLAMDQQYRACCQGMEEVIQRGAPHSTELTQILTVFKQYATYLHEGHYVKTLVQLQKRNQRLFQKLRALSQPSKRTHLIE